MSKDFEKWERDGMPERHGTGDEEDEESAEVGRRYMGLDGGKRVVAEYKWSEAEDDDEERWKRPMNLMRMMGWLC